MQTLWQWGFRAGPDGVGMDRITATIASIGIAASLAWSVAPAPEPTNLPASRSTTIVGGTAVEQDVVRSALDRYVAAGLELPSLVVTIDHSGAACKGHNGLYRASGDRHEIAICHVSEYVVLHELAHAWEHDALADGQRAAYVEAQALGSWSDPDTPWRLQGIEHIANTLAAALRHDGTGCSDAIAERYESLTGLHCDPRSTGA